MDESATQLLKFQKAALEYITRYARGRKKRAQEQITHILQMSNIARSEFDEAVSTIKTWARVALHFHPDRPNPQLTSVAEALLESGLYKSQFETMLSNGSLSAFPGGERDDWENKIFGGAYHTDGVTNEHRPKYGALDLMLHGDGPSPRFGSCYFLLKPEVSRRCTFTYLDSHTDPAEKGTFEEFDDIISSLMFEAFLRDFAIGESGLTPRKLINHLCSNLKRPFDDPANKVATRNLNHYIEAQVHGEVSLKDDVDILVADPSFQRTDTGKVLRQMCAKYGIDLYWHCGFAMSVDEFPDDFRGPTMPSLARRIATEAWLDPSMIGPAVFDLKQNANDWKDRGTPEEVLQELKYIWHVLVKYGQPLQTFSQ
jgi:hypothetical protein